MQQQPTATHERVYVGDSLYATPKAAIKSIAKATFNININIIDKIRNGKDATRTRIWL